MKTHFILIASLAALSLASCSKDQPDEVSLSAEVDKASVKVGEPVTFTIRHNVNSLAIYTGDEGHNYQNSIDNLLKDKSKEELQEKMLRLTNPNIKPYAIDFKSTDVGATTLADGAFEVRNANDGNNLVGKEAEVVDDGGIKAVKINATHPNWWYQALRLNINSEVGDSKTLTLRMKFATTTLKSANDQSEHPEVTTIPVVIRLGGIPEGETATLHADDTVWDIFITPQTAYTDYSFDIARVIAAWEKGTGKTMKVLSYIQILFTTQGGAAVGYLGDYYVQSAKFGEIGYLPFDTAKSFTITDNTGVTKYTYTYDKEGTYEAVVVGSSSGFKHYSGSGYKKDIDKISGDEYRYNTQYRTIKITVSK